MDLASIPKNLTAQSLPPSFWFCSLDVSAKSRVVVTGDNVGNVILLNMDGKEVRSWELGSSLSFPYPQPPFSAST